MLAFLYSFALIFAETHGAGDKSAGGFLDFYNRYLNIPGFEAWKFFNLAVFIGILAYLVKKPLSDAFKAKRETIRAELIKAAQEKEAALAELTAAEAKLVGIESERTGILKHAAQEADEEKSRIAAQTEHDINKMHEQAENEIERLFQQTKSGLRRYSAEESIRLAEEKIRSVMNTDTDSRLVRENIRSIGGLK